MAGVGARARLAGSLLVHGEVQRARAMYEEIVRREHEVHPVVAARYADALSQLGLHAEALDWSDRAITELRAASNVPYLVGAQISRARLLLRTDRLDEAELLLQALMQRLTEAGDTERLVRARLVRAEVLLNRDASEAAAAEMSAVFEALDASGGGALIGSALMLRSRIEGERGRSLEALEYAQRAADFFLPNVRDPSASAVAAKALETLAEAQLRTGDSATAAKNLAHAREAYARALGEDHLSTLRVAEALANMHAGPAA